MPRAPRILSAAVATALVAIALAVPGAAAGYDRSNPNSTGCTTKSASVVAATVRTYGVWQVGLKRSAGCNTVWAFANRTDTKKCQTGSTNCVKVKVVRTRLGVVTSSGARRSPVGSRGAFSLQLEGRPSSSFVGTAVTPGGRLIGTTGTLRVDAAGHWSTA